MSTSPDSNARADDRLVTLISHWLARHLDDAELLRGLETIGVEDLAPAHAEAVEELVAELRDPEGHSGALEMVARETLEALAHGG
jgi:hypothetical protein